MVGLIALRVSWPRKSPIRTIQNMADESELEDNGKSSDQLLDELVHPKGSVDEDDDDEDDGNSNDGLLDTTSSIG